MTRRSRSKPLLPNTDVFWVPKEGNKPEEYEDAFAVNPEKGRFAIADGATESAFARQWACILTEAAMNSTPKPGTALIRWLKPLQCRWHDGIDWETLPWFSFEKARQGAFSSLLTLELQESRPKKPSEAIYHWRALAIGDSCLFHLRDNTLLVAFPLTHADEFGSHPALLSSNPNKNSGVWEEVCIAKGDCQPGSLFILATDAFSHWFLAECEHGGKPWDALQGLSSQEEFQEWVTTLRRAQMMRNDDVTVVLIHAMARSL